MRNTELRHDAIVWLAALAALLAVPFLTSKTYIVHEVTIFLLFAAIVIYWNVIFGFSGILSLGQMAFFGVGGYMTAILVKFAGFGFLPAIVCAMLAAGAFGLLVGLACLRLRGPYVAFITLAIVVVLQKLIETDLTCVFQQQFGCSSLTGGPTGLSRFGRIGDLAVLAPLKTSYLLAVGNFILAMMVAALIVRGVVGKGLMALRDDERLAAARGINRVRLHIQVFAFMAAMTGLTGGLYVAYNGTVSPTMMDFSTLTLLLTMMIVGGMGTLYGPVLGAVLIYALDFWFKDFGAWRSMALGGITVLAVLLLPGGVAGVIRSVRSLRRTPLH